MTAGFDGVAYSPEAEKAIVGRRARRTRTKSSSRTASAVSGGQVDKRAEVGDAATTICAIAAEVGADVIVVGSHGRKGV